MYLASTKDWDGVFGIIALSALAFVEERIRVLQGLAGLLRLLPNQMVLKINRGSSYSVCSVIRMRVYVCVVVHGGYGVRSNTIVLHSSLRTTSSMSVIQDRGSSHHPDIASVEQL